MRSHQCLWGSCRCLVQNLVQTSSLTRAWLRNNNCLHKTEQKHRGLTFRSCRWLHRAAGAFAKLMMLNDVDGGHRWLVAPFGSFWYERLGNDGNCRSLPQSYGRHRPQRSIKILAVGECCQADDGTERYRSQWQWRSEKKVRTTNDHHRFIFDCVCISSIIFTSFYCLAVRTSLRVTGILLHDPSTVKHPFASKCQGKWPALIALCWFQFDDVWRAWDRFSRFCSFKALRFQREHASRKCTSISSIIKQVCGCMTARGPATCRF